MAPKGRGEQSPSWLREERRFITALFADLSGFTALADRLDPEALVEIIDPIITRLSSIVGSYEGYVDKFAGDALLAFFGAPVSHEDDAERALLVALEMHDHMRRATPKLPPEGRSLQLRIGVNSGPVVARMLAATWREDYSVLGDAVNVAQRLQAAAPPGETYVAASTMELAGDRFSFERVGELRLKGKSVSVATWRLGGERPGIGPRGRRLGIPLVGRRRELGALADTLQPLFEGRGGVLAITGEAGVGKSRLAQEVRARAAAGGARWLDARCLDYATGTPYWPYSDLLRRSIGVRPGEPADAARLTATLEADGAGKAGPFFAALLGGGEPEHPMEPEAFRRGLHDGFASWIGALARRTPVVLSVEDLHWADPSSLALTREIAALTAEEPVLLLLTGRTEFSPTAQEIASAVGEDRSLVLALEPLGPKDVQALIETILEGPVPPDLLDLVCARAGGNPLFVEEIVRGLRDTGALTRSGDAWGTRDDVSEETVPRTIDGILSARLDRLPPAATTLLHAAAVIGRRARVDLVREASGVPDIDSPLAQLVSGGFFYASTDGSERAISFHHALVQEVAYGRLLRKHRRELHRRVAEAAERLYGSGDDVIDLLARHHFLGETGRTAIGYLIRAADRSRRLFANEEAIGHLTHAVELARQRRGDVGLEEMLLGLADLYELVGNYEDALGLYEEVRDRSNDPRAWRGAGATLRKQGRYGEAIELLTRAIEDAGLGAAEAPALWLERGWTLSTAGRLVEAIEALLKGLATSGGRRDSVEGHLLLQLARARTVEGRTARALEHGLDARRIFEEQGDLRGLATALRIVGDAFTSLDRLDEAAAALREGLAIAERVGSVEELGGCLINLGLVELRRGELDEAVDCEQRAVVEFERVGHASGRAIGYSNLAFVLTECADYPRALAYAERALALSRSLGNALSTADSLQALATIHHRQGDSRKAAGLAEEAAGMFLEIGADGEAAECYAVAAAAREACGEAAEAARLRKRSNELSEGRRPSS